MLQLYQTIYVSIFISALIFAREMTTYIYGSKKISLEQLFLLLTFDLGLHGATQCIAVFQSFTSVIQNSGENPISTSPFAVS